MAREAPKIRPMSDQIIGQLRSETTIRTLNGVVVGLFCNSLDAGSSKITVEVDYNRGNCSVEDNGNGILGSDFSTTGGLARPFHTSKYNQPISTGRALHGIRGTFLSSLGMISFLSIASKHQNDTESSELICVRGERINNISQDREASSFLESRQHGTKVMVRDLFGNLPVRVRQRPSGEQGRRQRERCLRDLMHIITGLLLAWHSEVHIQVRCDAATFRLGHSLPDNKDDGPEGTDCEGHRFSALQLNLLGQICPFPASRTEWVQVSARGSSFRIQGFISTRLAPTRSVQFISLGVHHLPADGNLGIFYKCLNWSLLSSDLRRQNVHRESSKRSSSAPNRIIYLSEEDEFDERATEKSFRVPMFYIRVETRVFWPRLEPSDLKARDISEIKNTIEAMATSFLDTNGLRKRKRQKVRRPSCFVESSLHHQDQSCLISRYPENWQEQTEFKIEQSAQKADDSDSCRKSLRGPATQADGLHIDNLADLSLSVSREISQEYGQGLDTSLPSSVDPPMEWLGDVIDETDLTRDDIASQEGNNTHRYISEFWPAAKNPDRMIDNEDLTTCSNRQEIRHKYRELRVPINDTFNAQKNSAFAAVPATASFETRESLLSSRKLFSKTMRHEERDHGFAFDSFQISSAPKISRAQLLNARFVAQIEKKFILASASCIDEAGRKEPNSACLMLIDQHAADERIRLEALLSELCQENSERINMSNIGGSSNEIKIRSVRLDEPMLIDSSSHDERLLKEDAGYFRQWGVNYSIWSSKSTDKTSETRDHSRQFRHSFQLVVHSLPSVIAERGHLNHDLVKKMILQEVRLRDERGLTGQLQVDRPRLYHDNHQEGLRWVGELKDCPQGILDMISSRACRSAIMFNEELDDVKCQNLLRKLSNVAFPFQCAHGRPSLIPLQGLPETQKLSDFKFPSFAESWNSWRAMEKSRVRYG